MNSWTLALRVCALSASIILGSGISVGAIALPGVDAFAIALAGVAGFALAIVGVPVSLDGAVVNADGFIAVIAAQCTAIELIFVFSAAVLVWRAPFRARILGMLLGAVALSALNLVRVMSLLLIGVGFPEHFDTAHLVVWQTAMALIAFAMWLLWLRWASDGARANDARARASS